MTTNEFGKQLEDFNENIKKAQQINTKNKGQYMILYVMLGILFAFFILFIIYDSQTYSHKEAQKNYEKCIAENTKKNIWGEDVFDVDTITACEISSLFQ